MTDALLTVEDLAVEIRDTAILHGVSFSIERGTMRGLVGETGSGKSMTANAVVGLLPREGRISGGRIMFEGQDLARFSEEELRNLRGPAISMVFQNPRTALYPMLTVEKQMANVVAAHTDLRGPERRALCREHLELAGIRDSDRIARSYPHELSGGLAQRVVIATALVCNPRLLIADEPTTGLDATIQAQILATLARLQRDLSLTVLMITHDLGIVAQFCDDVTVMDKGRVVESGSKREILLSPREPYTQALVAASKLTDLRGTPQEVQP